MSKLDVIKNVTGATTRPLSWPKFLATRVLTRDLFAIANLVIPGTGIRPTRAVAVHLSWKCLRLGVGWHCLDNITACSGLDRSPRALYISPCWRLLRGCREYAL